MIKKKMPSAQTPVPEAPLARMEGEAQAGMNSEKTNADETLFETVAGYCSVLVVCIFMITFLAQGFVIPSGSMEKTLLVGDHVVVDRITLAPPARWMPLVRYREPRRGDVVVFIKPVTDDVEGKPEYLILVKRLIGVPGDHIRLRDGVVMVNGVEQSQPHAQPTTAENHMDFLDEFPAVQPDPEPGNLIPESWAADFPSHIENGELVVPAGKYFMMGDNRHNSADSRFWGFVPRENIIGRPMFNFWSFRASEDELEQTGLSHNLAWMGHVVLHILSDTRWTRTLEVIR
jgi:signal peptidase I